MWILKMRAPQAKILNFWNLPFQNGKMDGEWTDFPLRNMKPLIGQPPWNLKYFGLPQKPKIPKFQLTPPPLEPSWYTNFFWWYWWSNNPEVWLAESFRLVLLVSTNLWPMFPVYIPWKNIRKIKGFFAFSEGIKWEHWPEMD